MSIEEYKQPSGQVIEFNPDQIELLKKTVAKGATNEEFEMFLYLSKHYGLDPFKKEIFFTKFKSDKTGEETANNIVGRDGYLKIAQAHPEYDGLISFVVRENDVFEIDAAHYEITHKFAGAKRGAIIGAWARCDRKGKRPQICYVEYEEYKGTTRTWTKFPSAMIQKVAEVFVLRRQFNISGLVAREEIDYSEDGATFNYTKQQSGPKPPVTSPPKAAALPAAKVEDPKDPGKTQIVPKSETAAAKQNMIEGEIVSDSPESYGEFDDGAFEENIENLLDLAAQDAALENTFDFGKWLKSLKIKEAGTKAEAVLLTKIGATEKAFKFKVNGNEFFGPKSQCVEEGEGVWIPTWLLKKKQADIEK